MQNFKPENNNKILNWAKALEFKEGYGLAEYLENRANERNSLEECLRVNREHGRSDYHIRQALYKCDNQITDYDGKIRRIVGGVECTADALISFYTITHEKTEESNEYFEPYVDKIIENYFHYVKVPIFMFPCHQNSINQRRYYKFDDRIDMTLYDIKKELDARENSKDSEAFLKKVYKEEGTDTWLKFVIDQARLSGSSGFSYLCRRVFFIDSIFVDEKDNVINLDTNEVLTDEEWRKYEDGGSGFWTFNYYENLQEKINEWYKQQKFICG